MKKLNTLGICFILTLGCMFSFSITSFAQGMFLDMNASYVTCEVSSDGSASVNVGGGEEPLSYEWSDGQTFVVAYDLAAGDYSVTVTDANGNTAVGEVTVELSPESIWLMPTSTDSGCGSCDGTAEPHAMLGVPPYTYEWSDGQTTEVATGLCPGTYSVTVTDTQGCQGSTSVEVGDNGNLSVSGSSNDASCGGSDGSATASPNGGTEPYTYSWSNGGSTKTIDGLSPGTYTVEVHDAEGCSGSTTVTVGGGGGDLDVDVDGSLESCFGNDASATANVNGGSGNYTYSWSNGGSTQTISGLSAGTYTVTVTDGDCMDIASVTIEQFVDEFTINVSGSDASCADNDGSASVSVDGGSGWFEYTWSNGATGTEVSNLSPGTYMVTVLDTDTGCSDFGSITIGGGGGDLDVTVVTTDSECGQNNGTATANVDGSSTYTYVWSNGMLGSPIANLAPGTYTVTVTDVATGCTGEGSGTVNGTDAPDAGTISTTDPTEICAGDGIGDPITVTNSGASGSNFVWVITDADGNILDFPTGPTFDLDGAGPGVCLIWYLTFEGDLGGTFVGGNASDITGCFDLSNPITVTRTESPTVMIAPEGAVVCAGDPLALTANTTGDNLTYSWTATGGSFDDASSANPSWTMMMPGTYTITLDVASGDCTATASIDVVIVSPAAGTISTDDPTYICTGDGVGDPIDVTVSGNSSTSSAWVITDADGNILALPAAPPFDLDGAGPGVCLIWYLAFEGDIAGAAVGNNAADLDGCFELSNPIEVTRVAAPNVSIFASSTVVCDAGGVQLTAQGDDGLTYEWTSAVGVLSNPNDATTTFRMGMPGTYTITLKGTREDGCMNTATVDITVADFSFTLDVTTIDECGDLGSISVNGSGNYGYLWSNGATTSSITDLGAGTYCVTVLDNDTGCSAEECVTLTAPGSNIGNYVWYDNNENCTQDTWEQGVPHVNVCLYTVGDDGIACNGDDELIGCQRTDDDGHYLFECVGEGTYYVSFDITLYADYEFTCQDGDDQSVGGNAGTNNDDLDSDANQDTGKTDPFDVTSSSGDDLSIDAGINPLCNDVNYGGSLCDGQTICAGEIPSKIESCAPAGGGGSNDIEYLWLCNDNDSDPFDSWAPIEDSNVECFQPGALYQSKYYVRCARRAGCPNYLVESNVVCIEVVSCGNIVNFTATAQDYSMVRLTWVTNSDTDDNMYYVERSFNGIDFTVIDQMEGKGGQELTLYECFDHAPKVGRSYYRIKRVEVGGNYLYSNINQLVTRISDDQSFSVYPNPAIDVLNVHNIDPFESDVTVDVMTASGKVLNSIRIKKGTIVNDQFNLKDVPAGTYFLRVNNPDKTSELIKVTKLR